MVSGRAAPDAIPMRVIEPLGWLWIDHANWPNAVKLFGTEKLSLR
jgi:hypothetical protein